jgi:hypothetical protein
VSLDTLFDQTLTRIRDPKTGRGRYGSAEGGTLDEEDYPARLEQTQSTEVLVDRDTVRVDLIVFTVPDADITATDLVEVDGVTYRVVGKPQPAPGSPGAAHLEIRLQRFDG